LFNATRRTNATAPNYIATEILRKQPSNVAVLGLAYKRDVSDTFNSPAKQIQEILDARGLTTTGYDPNTKDGVEDIQTALADADVVLLAVNHSAFDDIEAPINEYTPTDATVYDTWGTVDPSKLDRTYDGFGMNGD
jgi:UDP-N-acetyl-D-mannosaminuronate dehydrogenase